MCVLILHPFSLDLSSSRLKLMFFGNSSFLKFPTIGNLGPRKVQGLRELRSESYCFFLLKYENYELFNPTGGSPDVVHLIK